MKRKLILLYHEILTLFSSLPAKRDYTTRCPGRNVHGSARSQIQATYGNPAYLILLLAMQNFSVESSGGGQDLARTESSQT